MTTPHHPSNRSRRPRGDTPVDNLPIPIDRDAAAVHHGHDDLTALPHHRHSPAGQPSPHTPANLEEAVR